MAADSDTSEFNAATTAAVRLLRLSHLTIERAADIVLWLDAAGTVRRVNEAVTRVLGYAPAELLQHPLARILAADGADARALWVSAEAGPAIREVELLALDGTRVAAEVALSHLRLGDDEYNCAIVRDIRERKRGELALREALDQVKALQARVEAENVYLRDEIKMAHDFDAIVGRSEPLQRILRHVQQVAPTDTSVLIQGESGTGKELFARAIHSHSPRSARALVKVNCAALPGTLIESELFGHERGAFTGAHQRRVGRFELAHEGTIFLDEIGELPIELQSKLLRVLQEGEFERLGDPRTHRVDVRVIAATNQDLERAIADGRFRQDLFYRLNVFPIRVPPLRERGQDVELLAQHFAAKYARKQGKPGARPSPAMLDSLLRHGFPGNIRELENLIERAVILSDGEWLDLDEPLDAVPAVRGDQAGARTLREVEVGVIREALQACDWVIGGKKGAAHRLDMAPSTLRERMQRYGIRRPG